MAAGGFAKQGSRQTTLTNKLPKACQKAAKGDLHAIWMADGRANAEKAMDTCAAKYEAKYPQAVTCLTKDRTTLLALL